MDSVWMDDTKQAMKSNEGSGSGAIVAIAVPGLAARRSALLPKLCPPNARDNFDSIDADQNVVTADFNFDLKYSDCGSFLQEISELYSYLELDDFLENRRCFEECAGRLNIGRWSNTNIAAKKNFLNYLLQDVERVEVERRLNSVRCFLYLLQGNFAECESKEEVVANIYSNAFLLYRCGLWSSLCMLLRLESDTDPKLPGGTEEVGSSTCCCIEDCLSIRLVLACMCTMLEAIRRPAEAKSVLPSGTDFSELQDCKSAFVAELSMPLLNSENSLFDLLLEMITRYCSGAAAHFPMRKVLLLTWKVVLTTCGGWDELRQLKDERRKEFGLSPCEDTIVTAAAMQPVSVQSFRHIVDGSSDCLDGELFLPRRTRPAPKRQFANMALINDDSILQSEESKPDGSVGTEPGTPAVISDGLSPASHGSSASATDSTTTSIPTLAAMKAKSFPQSKGLPWRPKIRQPDVQAFLESVRGKYFGFRLESSAMITVGLPNPIQECLEALQKHVYTSLSELQIEKEAKLRKFFFTEKEEMNLNPVVEPLYQTVLKLAPQLIIGLLKILLAAAPLSKGKTDVVNLMYEVMPRGVSDPSATTAAPAVGDGVGMGSVDSAEAFKLNVDISRQKEIISKAVSSLLLLLLKHFRLNHVYQFEYLSQNLVFANCIPLILKFFDQNMLQYVRSENELPKLAFPVAVLYHGKNGCWPPESFYLESAVSADQVSTQDATTSAQDSAPPVLQPPACETSTSTSYFLMRNLTTAINLLRIMNKLTKWKPARTMTLVVFKSAPILKRALKVKHAVLQLYALKLLKMQAKYLGRQWRKTNMEIMSAIYSRVRHRLTDDWAFGNETQAKPWEFQSDESTLMNEIEDFNSRRYKCGTTAMGGTCVPKLDSELDAFSAKDFEPFDHNVVSVLGTSVQFTDRYKRNYAKWLDNEVFKVAIDWDELLNTETVS